MRSRLIISLLIVVCLMLLFSTVKICAEEKADEKRPVVITSDSLKADYRDEPVMCFSGNVHVSEERGTIDADEIKVFLESEEGEEKSLEDIYEDEISKIKKIVAKGNVKLIQQDKKAFCDKAVFLRDKAEIIMTGSPEIWQQDTRFTGERIVLLLDSQALRIESGVKGIIYPENVGELDIMGSIKDDGLKQQEETVIEK